MILQQKWRDLFFLHWECAPELIQQTLPQGLLVDTYEGKAYVGIVPFRLFDMHPQFYPKFLGFSSFLEVNVRTYVVNEKGEKGVWFYSLDANHSLAVFGARTFFKLPYIYSEIQFSNTYNVYNFTIHRNGASLLQLEKGNAIFQAEEGTLEHFLTERYRFYTADKKKRIYHCDISHLPYHLSEGKILTYDTHLLLEDRLSFFKDKKPIHLVYSAGVEVLASSLKKGSF